jgi:hypothetical protein
MVWRNRSADVDAEKQRIALMTNNRAKNKDGKKKPAKTQKEKKEAKREKKEKKDEKGNPGISAL